MAFEDVDVPTAHAMWQAGDLVIDVRTPEEYIKGHIAGALSVPLRDLVAREPHLPTGQVIAVCSLGNRSRRGALVLSQLGRTAFSLRGGTKAWARAGYPVVTGTEPGPRRRPSLWRQLGTRLKGSG